MMINNSILNMCLDQNNPNNLIESLLIANKKWSAEISEKNSDFFRLLQDKQHPKILWIGCSDSRVPAETIVNANPGDMFVHRNIANQVISTDLNCLSVVQYAIAVLHVEHIIVCGHYGCGGVQASLESQQSNLTITNKWLMYLKDTYRLYRSELELYSGNQMLERFVQLNVLQQVNNLSHTSIVQSSWRESKLPLLHGMVYHLNNGLLEKLITLDANSPMDPIYRYSVSS